MTTSSKFQTILNITNTFYAYNINLLALDHLLLSALMEQN